MSAVSAVIDRALANQRMMLEADGYELHLAQEGPDVLVAEIRAGPAACADCLVPKEMMRAYFEKALHDAVGRSIPAVRLVYPADAT